MSQIPWATACASRLDGRSHTLHKERDATGDRRRGLGCSTGVTGEWQGPCRRLRQKAARRSCWTASAAHRPRVPISGSPSRRLRRARIDFIAGKGDRAWASRSCGPVITRRSEPLRVNTERLTNIAIEAAEQDRAAGYSRGGGRLCQLDKALAALARRSNLIRFAAEAGAAQPIAEAVCRRGVVSRQAS